MYTVAGVSVHNGKVKVRFCSDLVLRFKNLNKQGDTDIKLIELPASMTKEQACEYLLTLPGFKVYQLELEAVLGKKNKQNKPLLKAKPAVKVDKEIEDIKQLAAA